MKKLALLLMISSFAQAQSLNYLLRSQMPVIENKDGKKIASVKVMANMNNQQLREYKFLGSPFLIDTFQTTTYSVDGNKTTTTAPALLNLTTDELLVKIGDKVIAVKNATFTIDGHNFMAVNERYYEVLYNGKVKLLKRYDRNITGFIINNTSAVSGYGKSESLDGEINNKETYLLAFHDNTLRDIKLTPKSVISALAKENKSHYVSGEFGQAEENDGLIKAFNNVASFDEKELITILSAYESNHTL